MKRLLNKKKLHKVCSLLAFVLLLQTTSWGQLLTWNTFGNAGTETTEPSVSNDANISAVNLTQGTITAASNGNRFGGSGWFNTGNTAAGNTLAEAVAGNDYIQFIVTPNTGYSFTPTSFVFNWDHSGTGPLNLTLRSSVDAYAADLGTVAPAAAIGTSNTITITGLTALTTATTFRLYGYGATATGGTGGFDVSSSVVNVQLNGTTAATSCSAPTTQASSITFGSVASTSMTVGTWTNGNGSKRVVIMNTSNSFTNPTDGTDPSANTVYSGSGEQVIYNNSGNSVAITGLTASTTYWFRVYEYNCTGASTKFYTATATNNPNSQATTAPTPTLTVSPSTLTGFTYVQGVGPSTSQTYTLSGANLTGSGNITVTGSTNYEVSTDNTTFGASVTYPFASGIVTGQPKSVYIRLKAGLATASYNGETVSNAGGGATTVNVTCSGTVTAPTPTLSVSPTSLTSYTYVQGSGPSASQTYVLSGSNLTGSGNITITGSTNYEVSTDNSTFAASATYPFASGIVTGQPKTVYIRLKAGLATASYNSETVSNAGGGAATVNVTCSGNVTAIGCSNEPLPYTQGFNSTSIPACWSQQTVVGAEALTFVASSSSPGTTPQEGSHYVYWNSYNFASGRETRLVSPAITTTGTASVDVSFWWKNNNNLTYSSGNYLNEGAEIQYSLDGTTWSDVSFVPRHDGSLGSGASAWDLKTITLPAGAGNQATIYVGFKFHSSYGDNCSLDNITIEASSSTSSSISDLANWNFPNDPDNEYPDGGVALNYDSGTPASSFGVFSSNNGGTTVYNSPGVASKCANSTNWNAGSGTYYWKIKLATTGFSALKLSSKQRSSPSGPRDWKTQYSLDNSAWTDITSGTVTNADNWTSGVLTNLSLPAACENQPSVYIRWIMTSNTSVNAGTVASTGSSRIDNIQVTGNSMNSVNTGTISGSPFCVTTSTGTSVSIPFTSSGVFNTGNVYTAQLSDALGSFSIPTDIGTLSSTSNSGTITATILANTQNGLQYRIRVISSDAPITGTVNGTDLSVMLNTSDVSSLNALTASGQVTLGWTNPLGCYDAVLIVASTSSIIAGTPAGDGTAYTANLTYGSGTALLGGFVVYKGTASGQTVISLTGGTIYYFKVFVRKGTAWSNGVEISVVPSGAQTGDFRSAADGTWTTQATWQAYNGASWVTASSYCGCYPNDTLKNVTITNGTTVTLNNSPMKLKNLTVESGGKVYANLIPDGSNNQFVSIYGSNLSCNGIIGNGNTDDAMGINIEGINVTISGTGVIDANRLRKNYTSNLITNLIIAMNINLRWNAVSGTQIYNNSASTFNILLNAGSILNLIVSGAGNSGNACIDGVNGSDLSNKGGTWTINGTMNIPGILYATTNNIAARPCTWIIGNGGVVNCNQVNCSNDTTAVSGSGAAGHTLRILSGGLLNMATNRGFTYYSENNNTYDFQDGSTVEYSANSGTQVIQPTTLPATSNFVYSNLWISTDGATKQVDNSNNLHVLKNLLITGGVLDPNGKNIFVGGNWNNYGTAGFTEGTGTESVYFNGASAQEITCIGGENFNKLDFSSAGTKTLQNDITAASDITINSASGALIANSNNITIGGNWSNYGTAGFTEGTNGAVTFNGSAAQTVTCTGGEDYYNCTINNTSTGITLANTLSVANVLTLTSGIVHTGANEMYTTLEASNSITGYQTDPTLGSFTTSAYIDGYLRRNIDATGSYDFPVGTSANYELANITLNSSTGMSNILAHFTNPHTGTTPSGIYIGSTEINAMLDYGFWTITPNAYTAVDYDVTCVSYGHTNGGSDASAHTIIKRANSAAAWATYDANHDNSTQIGTGSNPVLAKLTAMTGFSDIAVGKGAGPLPIELLSFTAKYNGISVDLNWVTASELNNDYFTIERSADAVNFVEINNTDGAGNSNRTLFYSTIDTNPLNGISYYRLKQTDFNGQFSYSNIVSINIDKKDAFQIVNTFNSTENESLDVTVNCGNTCLLIFELFDMTGKKVNASTQNITGNNKIISIPTTRLSQGIYLLKVYNGKEVISKKVKL